MNVLLGQKTLSHCFSSLLKSLLWKERICSQGEQILSFYCRPLFRKNLNCRRVHVFKGGKVPNILINPIFVVMYFVSQRLTFYFRPGSSCSKLTMSLVNDSLKFTSSDTQICWNFSAKNIRILYIESAKTVNEKTLNELVKLTTLWTTGPRNIVRAGILPDAVMEIYGKEIGPLVSLTAQDSDILRG